MQHDAHELVRLLMDRIERSLVNTQVSSCPIDWSIGSQYARAFVTNVQHPFYVSLAIHNTRAGGEAGGVPVPGGPGVAGALPGVRHGLGAQRGLLRRLCERPGQAHAGGACVRVFGWSVVLPDIRIYVCRSILGSFLHLTPSSTRTQTNTCKQHQAGLDEAFKAEVLEGENRYACDACARKTAADRSVAVRTLPPVLLVSLNRFEYDMLTAQRRKVGDVCAVVVLLCCCGVSCSKGSKLADLTERTTTGMVSGKRQTPLLASQFTVSPLVPAFFYTHS